jgi:hypothetical protein
VPYILPAGLWILAVASVITLFQRIVAVHKGLAVPVPPADGEAPAENRDENQTGSATAAQTID